MVREKTIEQYLIFFLFFFILFLQGIFVTIIVTTMLSRYQTFFFLLLFYFILFYLFVCLFIYLFLILQDYNSAIIPIVQDPIYCELLCCNDSDCVAWSYNQSVCFLWNYIPSLTISVADRILSGTISTYAFPLCYSSNLTFFM